MPIRTNLHTIPYDGGESTSIPPALPHQNVSSTTATVPCQSIAKVRCNRRLHMCANRKLHSSKLFCRSGPTYTPYHMMVESRPLTSIPPDSPHQTTSSTTATVPRRSIANRHVNRRLHRYDNCKLRSSKLFCRLGPTYTPYHMMVESRPLYTSCLSSSQRLFDYGDGTTPIHCQQARQSSST